MKKYTIILASLILLLTNCNRWNDPLFEAPVYVGPIANKTIADIKAMHPSLGTGAQDSICKYDEPFIVKAVVVSSDQGGNCYKYITVQDETGGIEISVDRSSLYNEYPVGQTVYINCAGLIVGDYYNKYQIGWKYNGSVGRIHPTALSKYISKDGLPNPDNPLLANPIEIKSSNELVAENTNCFVKINGCKFAGASHGQPLASNDFITDHEVTINGATVVVRTSNYANFRNTIIDATKEYCLYGILSIYKQNYQLTLRTKEDIQASEVIGENILAKLTFDENSFSSGGWTQYPDNQSWKYQYFNGNHFMYHTNTSSECDDWLISPEITIEDFAKSQLFIDHQNNVAGSPASYYQIYYSTTYNGGQFNAADWVAFSPNILNYPNTFAMSNALPLSNVGSNKFRIAFRYRKNGAIDGTRWSIRGVKISSSN